MIDPFEIVMSVSAKSRVGSEELKVINNRSSLDADPLSTLSPVPLVADIVIVGPVPSKVQ